MGFHSSVDHLGSLESAGPPVRDLLIDCGWCGGLIDCLFRLQSLACADGATGLARGTFIMFQFMFGSAEESRVFMSMAPVWSRSPV